MEKRKKQIRYGLYFLVILLSVIVIMIISALNLSQAAELILLIIWILAVSVAVLAIDSWWYREIGKKYVSLAQAFQETLDADQFIEGINKVFHGVTSVPLNNCKYIGLCAAYDQKKEYLIAKEMLSRVRIQKLSTTDQAVYWADMALICFHLGQKEQACAIMDKQAAAFWEQKESEVLGGTLAVLDIHRALAEGRIEAAKELLDDTRVKWTHKRFQETYSELEKVMDEFV